MTREEAKDIVFNYALEQKINDGINTLDEIIDQIFDYFGEQLQYKDDEIERLENRVYALENDTILQNMEQRLIDISLVINGKLTSKDNK